MRRDSEQVLDSSFLSYNKILRRLHSLGITTKHGKEITHMDLKKGCRCYTKKTSNM